MWKLAGLATNCLLAVGLMLTTGCEKPRPAIMQLPPPEVEVAAPVSDELQDLYESTGTVRAVHEVEIRPRVSGYITEVTFSDGAMVTSGTTLFKIDPRPYEATLSQAKANVTRAEASLAKAERDFGREKELREKKVNTQADYDRAIADRDLAAAEVLAAKAAVDQATLDVEFCTVKAPIDGRMSEARITAGNLIGPTTTSNGVLTTIVSVDPMYVDFNVDERTVIKIRNGFLKKGQAIDPSKVADRKLKVAIRLDNQPDLLAEGMVDFIDNRVDPNTGTVPLRAVLVNSQRLFDSGMFVRVDLPCGDKRPVLLVPDTAIGTSLNQKYVLTVDAEGRARRRPIQLGTLRNGLREILSDANAPPINESDKIVVSGLQRVRENQPVTVLPAAGSASEAAKSPPDKSTPGKSG